MAKLPTILVITERFTDSFMAEDLRILRQFANVVTLELGTWQPQRKGLFWGRIRQLRNLLKFITLCVNAEVGLVLFWFAYLYETPLLAAAAKVLGCKTALITGGIDAVYVPEIDWGKLKTANQRAGFGWLMRLVDRVWPFSNSAKQLILQQYQPHSITTIYPAIDTDFFTPAPGQRTQRVVTCCYQYGAREIVQKGLDTFVETARRLPNVEFVLIGNGVGEAAEAFIRQSPSNVTFMPRIPTRAGYRDFLQRCSVYAQLSVHEGFGVSLAEAMACGCMPVVTDRYSLPEVAGPHGFLIPYGPGRVDAAAAAIKQALTADTVRRQQMRNHIIANFTEPQRIRAFQTEIAQVLGQPVADIVRVELGCGNTGVPGTIGVDLRMTQRTQAVCDVRQSCFASGSADEVYSYCVLEHLDNPYELLDEVVRVLKPDGQALLRVPNIGTFSAHLDTTHRFLADLKIWKAMMQGYFQEVKVVPLGTKYRDNRVLTAINWGLVYLCGFHELAQGWTFVCRHKRATPRQAYTGWWQEPSSQARAVVKTEDRAIERIKD